MDIVLNGTKWLGFEPTAEGFSDLLKASGVSEEDARGPWLQSITEYRKGKVSAECRRRIYIVASPEAQMNMAAASALISSKASSARTDEDKEILVGLEAAIGWVSAMRTVAKALTAEAEADFTDDVHWPDVPASAAAVAGQF